MMPAESGGWRWWILKAGRGWGKNRTGAETVKMRIERGLSRRIGLVGYSAGEVRGTMIFGKDSLADVFADYPDFTHEPTKRQITFPISFPDVVISTYSADQPDQLRGPQHDFLWIDEFCKFPHAREVLYNAELGLRLGDHPCGMISTTPKAIPEFLAMLKDPANIVAGRDNPESMWTIANAPNLSRTFFERVYKIYEGTRLGRQELQAEIDEKVPGALWWSALLEQHRCPGGMPPGVTREYTVVSVDPATSSPDHSFDAAEYESKGLHHPEIGIIVSTRGSDNNVYVLFDASLWCSPREWAMVVHDVWRHFRADLIVAEKNNGGVLVESNIHAYDDALPVELVWASEGKRTRAEPVANLYERGLVHHCGPAERFGKLEDQMTKWVPMPGNPSPDRMDALVWGVWKLRLEGGRMIEPGAAGEVSMPQVAAPGRLIERATGILPDPAAAFAMSGSLGAAAAMFGPSTLDTPWGRR